jgi:hypothetical protein
MSITDFNILAQLASLLNTIPGKFILSALVSPILQIAIGYLKSLDSLVIVCISPSSLISDGTVTDSLFVFAAWFMNR